MEWNGTICVGKSGVAVVVFPVNEPEHHPIRRIGMAGIGKK